ncbi:MAG: hypothetical protein PVI01_19805 [Gemmatimonadales bacterium]
MTRTVVRVRSWGAGARLTRTVVLGRARGVARLTRTVERDELGAERTVLRGAALTVRGALDRAFGGATLFTCELDAPRFPLDLAFAFCATAESAAARTKTAASAVTRVLEAVLDM